MGETVRVDTDAIKSAIPAMESALREAQLIRSNALGRADALGTPWGAQGDGNADAIYSMYKQFADGFADVLDGVSKVLDSFATGLYTMAYGYTATEEGNIIPPVSPDDPAHDDPVPPER